MREPGFEPGSPHWQCDVLTDYTTHASYINKLKLIQYFYFNLLIFKNITKLARTPRFPSLNLPLNQFF